MGTPDRFPGKRIEETLALEDQGGPPAEIGEIQRNGSDIFAKDGVGVFNLRTGGSGITEAQHQALRQLIHFVDNGPANGFASGAFRETLPSADPFPTSVTWYDDATKAKKFVEKLITYTGVTATAIVWKMYDIDGITVLQTVTDVISYSGVFETTRTRTIA